MQVFSRFTKMPVESRVFLVDMCNGNVPEGDRNWRRRERQEPKEDWGGCREVQQSYLGMELHPWRGKGGRLGPVAQAAGGARPGGTTVAAETYNPAWSVADEDFTQD